MSLQPAVTVTLGNLRYDSHVSALRVDLTLLPGVNSFKLGLPANVKFSAAPGDDAVLEVNGGEGSETVLTGKVRRVGRTFTGIWVTAADAGADLALLRPAVTYRNKSAADVVRALAGDAGVDIGSVDLDLDLAAYAAHQARTGAEHVAHLAALAAGIACVDKEGALAVVPAPGKDADVALLHGREFLTFEKRESPSPSVQRFAIGNGSAGAASSPEALKHSMGKIPDNAGPPGSDTVWQPSPVLRTPKSAMTASQGLNDRAAARTQVMRAGCFLLPALRPGMVVEIQELPGELGGSNWLLTRVIHRLDPRTGGRTQLHGVLAGARGESLLGALLGAIGGLL